MSLFGRGSNALKTAQLHSIRVTQSILGIPIPFVMGQNRVQANLIYYANFQSHENKQVTPGGKGIGSQTNVTYNYTAAIQAALCQGAINGITNIYDSNGKLGQSTITENFIVPAGGGSYLVGNAPGFGSDLGASLETPYNSTHVDFGAPGPTVLTGTMQTPLKLVPGSPGAGQYSVNTSGEYVFSAADAGSSVSITYTYSLEWLVTSETFVIPESAPYEVTVQQFSTFHGNISVLFYPSGVPVNGTLYFVQSNGVYGFDSSLANQVVLISYQYQDQNSLQLPTTMVNLTVFSGERSQAVWGYLTASYPGNAIGYTQVAYVASPSLNLGSNGELPNYNYEVLGLYPFGGGITDCNPAACIAGLLTDPDFGVQPPFPGANIDDFARDAGSAFAFWCTHSFFISPVGATQQAAAQYIQSWCDAGQVAPFFSEGLFKLVPYGDTAAMDNGYLFVPNTAPVADLNDDDFVSMGDNENPVQVGRPDQRNVKNYVKIEYYPRLNGYNADSVTEQDQGHIALHGMIPESPQSYDFITTLPAAQFAAIMRLRRNVYQKKTYTFKLGWHYSFLEPMDLVTLNDSEAGLIAEPVRITKTEDDGQHLTITAEEFPWGTANPTTYPKQGPGLGYAPDGHADPGFTEGLVFEAPDRAALQRGNVLYVFACGTNIAWGGCHVWLSLDEGASYQGVGPIRAQSYMGTLQTALTAGAALGSSLMLQMLANPIPTANAGASSVLWSAPASRIRCRWTDGVIDLPSASVENGLLVQMETATGSPTQDWQLVPVRVLMVGTSRQVAYKIRNYWTGKVLGVVGASTAAGALVQQYDDLGTDEQLWYLWPSGFGFFAVQNIHSGLSLDIVGESRADGAQLCQAVFTGTNVSQDFTFDNEGFYAAPQIWRHAASTGAGGTMIATGLFGAVDVTGVTDGETFYFVDGTNGTVSSQLEAHVYPSSLAPPTNGATLTLSPTPVPTSGLESGLLNIAWTAPGKTSTALWLGPPLIGVSQFIGYGTDTGFVNTSSVRNGSVFYLRDQTGAVILTTAVAIGAAQFNQSALEVSMDSPEFDLTSIAPNDQGGNLGALVVVNPAVPTELSGALELFTWNQVSLLDAPSLYQLTGVVRGAMGTAAIAHASGDRFAVITQQKLTYQYDPQYVGKKIYLKFTSFNRQGNQEQPLSAVPAFTYTLPGINTGPIALDTGVVQTGRGTVPPALTGGLTYYATDTSITFEWNIPIYRSDPTSSVQSLNGNREITGLSPSTTYYFYPYIDDTLSPPGFAMVIDGGIGSPYTWAHTTPSPRWTQEQTMATHKALSEAPVTAATLASGTTTVAGGSGGGTGSTETGGSVIPPPMNGYPDPSYQPGDRPYIPSYALDHP